MSNFELAGEFSSGMVSLEKCMQQSLKERDVAIVVELKFNTKKSPSGEPKHGVFEEKCMQYTLKDKDVTIEIHRFTKCIFWRASSRCY